MCAKSTFNFCLRDRAVLFAVIRNAVVNAFDNLARDGSYLAVSTPVNEREYIIFCDESEKKGPTSPISMAVFGLEQNSYSRPQIV
jgi:hypothetical protein